MLKYFKGAINFPLKLIPLAVCATILAAALSIYITTYQTNELYEMNAKIETSKQDVEWSAIEDMLSKEYTIAKKDIKYVAVSLEQSLRTNYPNLDVLQEQFINEEYSDGLNQIFRSILSDSYDETRETVTLIGTKDHVISMHSNTDKHILNGIDTSNNISWDEIAKITPNEKLTDHAIQSILKRDNKIIFTATDIETGEKNEWVSHSGVHSLQMIYEREGIEGLRGLSLLAAAYISDNGDIFGTEDKTFLKNNDNHKLIIVKTINVGDLLDENKLHMGKIIDTITVLSDTANSQGERSVIQSITWSFTLFILSLFMIAVYNSEARKGHLHSEDKNKGGK